MYLFKAVSPSESFWFTLAPDFISESRCLTCPLPAVSTRASESGTLSLAPDSISKYTHLLSPLTKCNYVVQQECIPVGERVPLWTDKHL